MLTAIITYGSSDIFFKCKIKDVPSLKLGTNTTWQPLLISSSDHTKTLHKKSPRKFYIEIADGEGNLTIKGTIKGVNSYDPIDKHLLEVSFDHWKLDEN